MAANETDKGKGRKGKEKERENAKTIPPPVKSSARDTKVNKDSKAERDSAWIWETLADASISDRTATFTEDGNYFFSVVGMSVRIYSAVTGEVVSTLSSTSMNGSSSRLPKGDGHTDAITATVINPENPFQLLTASLDGTIKIWDYLDANLLRTIRIGRPISQMCAHKKFKGHVFVAVLTKTVNGDISSYKGNTLIYRVSLKPKDQVGRKRKIQRSSEIVSVGKSRSAVAMAISPSGSWLVVIAGHKAYVSMTSSLESGFTKFVSPEKLTCLAFHPTDDYFATGDAQGQIRLWYCLNSQLPSSNMNGEKRAQTTLMHWHAHAVSSIAFTPNGAYLLSGGEESVLVIWQLQSGKREYVPRLGSPILHISVRKSNMAEEYLVGVSDGTYIFVDAGSLSVSRSIARMKLDPKGTSTTTSITRVPLATHRKSSTLILPASHSSSLQIYSPATSSLIAELEVSPSNRVSRRDEKPIEASRVEFAIVDSSGEWLATIDKRNNDEGYSEEVYLKIWRWESMQWVLNTRIDRPHASKSVVAVSFCPAYGAQGGLLMTAGLDGFIKTWSTRSINDEGRDEVFWVARLSFSFRDQTPKDVCWSPDGSLLAVCFDQQVVLYDPRSNSVLDCLYTPDARHTSSLSFIGLSGRYLIVSGKNNAVLWDLVNRIVAWRFHPHLEIARVLAHPTDDIFAMIVHPFAQEDGARTSSVALFRPESSTPYENRTLPFRFRAISWYRDDKGSCTLLGITTAWNIVLCSDEKIVPNTIEEAAREIPGNVALPSRTLFQDIFGQEAFIDTTTLARARVHSTSVKKTDHGGRASLSTFDTPAYLAPPLESLYSSIMNDFLCPAIEQKEVTKEINKEEDELMAIDEEETSPPAEGRRVDATEIENLTALFKSQAITPSAESSIRTNGFMDSKSKTSVALHSTTMNPWNSTPSRENGFSRTTPTTTELPQILSSPAVSGKKRKKSFA